MKPLAVWLALAAIANARKKEEEVLVDLNELLLEKERHADDGDDDDQPLLLSGLHVSAGEITPSPFKSSTKLYTVNLDTPTSFLSITPQIKRTLSYYTQYGFPKVTWEWKGLDYTLVEPTATSMGRTVPLPSDGSDQRVLISLYSATEKSKPMQYTINVKQKYPPVADLGSLAVYDDRGTPLPLKVDARSGSTRDVRSCLVDPEAQSVSLAVQCSDGCTLTVNGSKQKKNHKVVVKRDPTRFDQVVEITCKKPTKAKHAPTEKSVAVLLRSNFGEADILPPALLMSDLGLECPYTAGKGYSCPKPPSNGTGLVALTAAGASPAMRYTMRSSDGDLDARLLPDEPSAAFKPRSGMSLSGEGGDYEKEWPINFEGEGKKSSGAAFKGLGCFFGAVLALLLAATVGVVGTSSVWGNAVPLGASEICSALTYATQFLCFSHVARGSNAAESLTGPLRWVTFFFPAPFRLGDDDAFAPPRQLIGLEHNQYAIRLWGDSEMGDTKDVANAWGCLFWIAVCFTAVQIVHLCVYVKYRLVDKDTTFPHRLRWGNWENRAIHWFTFPAVVASCIVLSSDDGRTGEKVVAGCILALIVCWAIFVVTRVFLAVGRGDVVWIWSNSVREGATDKHPDGYWCDIMPDQLLTQACNRGIISSIFPYRWISTCADIVPVSLAPSLFEEKNDEVYPPKKMPRAHKDAAYPLGKTPQVVEVIRTCSPSHCCCAGDRLIAGLLRTKWLDTLFTQNALCTFFTETTKERGELTFPLIVKTEQLSGWHSQGPMAFFYDGVRVPFIRLGDLIFRIVVGVCMGLALAADEESSARTALFAVVAVSSLGFAIYTAIASPYLRKLENWLMVMVYAVTGITALTCIFSENHDGTMWMLVVLCVMLSVYAMIVIVSVFSAIMCPPLEESRFLESLANCSVTVTDERRGYTVEMPGYSKYSTKDLKAQAGEHGRVHASRFGSMEEVQIDFTAKEFYNACSSGYLPVGTQ